MPTDWLCTISGRTQTSTPPARARFLPVTASPHPRHVRNPRHPTLPPLQSDMASVAGEAAIGDPSSPSLEPEEDARSEVEEVTLDDRASRPLRGELPGLRFLIHREASRARYKRRSRCDQTSGLPCPGSRRPQSFAGESDCMRSLLLLAGRADFSPIGALQGSTGQRARPLSPKLAPAQPADSNCVHPRTRHDSSTLTVDSASCYQYDCTSTDADPDRSGFVDGLLGPCARSSPCCRGDCDRGDQCPPAASSRALLVAPQVKLAPSASSGRGGHRSG